MQQPNNVRLFGYRTKPQLSIVIPTYNEADNIINLLESIKKNIGNSIFAEIIVVDDNSPDGTGKLVDNYIKKIDQSSIADEAAATTISYASNSIIPIRTIHRKQ